MIMPSVRRTISQSVRVIRRLGWTEHDALHLIPTIIESAAHQMGDTRIGHSGWLTDLLREAERRLDRWHLAHNETKGECEHARTTEDR